MIGQTLLPPNATVFERAVEAATAFDGRSPAILPRPGAKLEGFGPFVPWLIWEYGLGEILPYLSDPQRAIREGVLWQRLRGTPEALRMAFSWRDLDHVQVLQEEPGQHFASFQIDTGNIASEADVDDLIVLARLSAPVRSRLARIFHGYDVRRFKLDQSRLDDALLSDYSGVLHTDGATRLSFGRVTRAATPVLGTRLHPIITVQHTGRAVLPGRFVLCEDVLGAARHTPNPFIYHAHLFSVGNFDGLPDAPADFLPRRKFQMAQIALSDSWTLGDTNARTPPPDHLFDHKVINLSDDATLSGAPRMLKRKRITEAFTRTHTSHIAIVSDRQHRSGAARQTVRFSTVGGRGQTHRLSHTRRAAPLIVVGEPVRADLRSGDRVSFTVGEPVRADLRSGDRALFTVGEPVRADARVAHAQRWSGTHPALVDLAGSDGLPDRQTASVRQTNVFGSAAYAGQYWLSLYHPDQNWSAVQVLIGSTHRTDA
jgi:P2-related tail formation protein